MKKGAAAESKAIPKVYSKYEMPELRQMVHEMYCEVYKWNETNRASRAVSASVTHSSSSSSASSSQTVSRIQLEHPDSPIVIHHVWTIADILAAIYKEADTILASTGMKPFVDDTDKASEYLSTYLSSANSTEALSASSSASSESSSASTTTTTTHVVEDEETKKKKNASTDLESLYKECMWMGIAHSEAFVLKFFHGTHRHLCPWIHSVNLTAGDIVCMRNWRVQSVYERKTVGDLADRYLDFKSQRVRLHDVYVDHDVAPVPVENVSILREYSTPNGLSTMTYGQFKMIESANQYGFSIATRSTSNFLDTVITLLSDFSCIFTKRIVIYKGQSTYPRKPKDIQRALLTQAAQTKAQIKTMREQIADSSLTDGETTVLLENRGVVVVGAGVGAYGTPKFYMNQLLVFTAQLMQFQGVSQEMASAIVQKYPTPEKLTRALKQERRKNKAIWKEKNTTREKNRRERDKKIEKQQKQIAAGATGIKVDKPMEALKEAAGGETALVKIEYSPYSSKDAKKLIRVGPTVAKRIADFYLDPTLVDDDDDDAAAAADDGATKIEVKQSVVITKTAKEAKEAKETKTKVIIEDVEIQKEVINLSSTSTTATVANGKKRKEVETSAMDPKRAKTDEKKVDHSSLSSSSSSSSSSKTTVVSSTDSKVAMTTKSKTVPAALSLQPPPPLPPPPPPPTQATIVKQVAKPKTEMERAVEIYYQQNFVKPHKPAAAPKKKSSSTTTVS